MKLMPSSTASSIAASESASSTGPQASPPIAHAPKPISETLKPVRPRFRYSIRPLPSSSPSPRLDCGGCASWTSLLGTSSNKLGDLSQTPRLYLVDKPADALLVRNERAVLDA